MTSRYRSRHQTAEDRGIVAQCRARVLASPCYGDSKVPVFADRVALSIVHFPTSREPAWVRINHSTTPASVHLDGERARVVCGAVWVEVRALDWQRLANEAEAALPGCTGAIEVFDAISPERETVLAGAFD